MRQDLFGVRVLRWLDSHRYCILTQQNFHSEGATHNSIENWLEYLLELINRQDLGDFYFFGT